MQTLGQWIQEKRGNRKAVALAEEAGMTPQQWSDLENDRSRRKDGSPARPTLETCRKVARVLGVPLDELLNAAGYEVGARDEKLVEWSVDIPGPIQNDPNSGRRLFYEPIDYPALQAFLQGLPPEVQREEYERVRRLYMHHQREQTDFGKMPDDNE